MIYLQKNITYTAFFICLKSLIELPTDDLFLLDRFINGNDDAFTIIYNRYVNQLMAYGMGWGFEIKKL